MDYEAAEIQRDLRSPVGEEIPGEGAALTRTKATGAGLRIGFVWTRFGPYHIDRCEACAGRLPEAEVFGIEIASFDSIYNWNKSGDGKKFNKITLFGERKIGEIGYLTRCRALIGAVMRNRIKHVFFCNYENPAIFVSAIILRLLGRRVYVMQDSKFDDKPRRMAMEFLKRVLYMPYQGALVSGPRAASYLEFLGKPASKIRQGYDTVSVPRIRKLADALPAPDGEPYATRHFTIIARIVPKKNLGMAIDAYNTYVRLARSAGQAPRDLVICGSGPLEAELHAQVSRLGLDGVRFMGFVQEEVIARTLGTTLALILPSIEEQHGLVINEAIAMGVPSIVSDNCGARDLLVRSGVNGFVIEPDNAEGLAYFMKTIAEDRDEWVRLSRGCARFVRVADSQSFPGAVLSLIDQQAG